MKNIVLSSLVIVLLVGCNSRNCDLEKEKTLAFLNPFVQPLEKHCETKGMPTDLSQVSTLPHKLTSCNEKPKLDACIMLRDQLFETVNHGDGKVFNPVYKGGEYFFKQDDAYIAVKVETINLNNKKQNASYLKTVYHDTVCEALIYLDGKINIKNRYSCMTVFKCKGWHQ